VVALNKGYKKKKENESFQKNFQKHLRETKELYFYLPLQNTRHCESNETKKQEEHVPRHIELTAVLREILRQRIESNRIERFE
jgi:hypothetical protein